jgi:hypothetical protein
LNIDKSKNININEPINGQNKNEINPSININGNVLINTEND